MNQKIVKAIERSRERKNPYPDYVPLIQSYEEIAARRAKGATLAKIAKDYGVTAQAVANMLRKYK